MNLAIEYLILNDKNAINAKNAKLKNFFQMRHQNVEQNYHLWDVPLLFYYNFNDEQRHDYYRSWLKYTMFFFNFVLFILTMFILKQEIIAYYKKWRFRRIY